MEEQLIEETTNTQPETTATYPMDMSPIEVKLLLYTSLEKSPSATHVMRKPTFEEEESRERKMPLITKDLGKVEGNNASSMTIDDEPANVALYDKIALTVAGYALKSGEKPTDEPIPVTQEIETPKGMQTVLSLIPASHKSTAINGMFPSTFEVDLQDQEFSFALGGGREWSVKQEIGGKTKREDGTLSPPNFTVYYTFREPTEAERKKYRTRAIAAVNVQEKEGGISERRSTNLKVMRELFDALIVSVDGATIGGKPIKISDSEHLSNIPATFKKSAVIRLFNVLDADLEN